MRKLYSFIAGFVFSLVLMQAKAQNDVANFTFTVSGNTANFTNTSTTVPNDTALRRCYWQFGDGNILFTNYSVNPEHTYSQPGTYEVCFRLFSTVNTAGTANDSLVLISTICKSVVIVGPDSCSANFETTPVSPTALGKYFTAQPWESNNKKPAQICWSFGDTHDTCIQYATSFTGAYSVFHNYAIQGNYNVCVKIVYDGGCQSYFCKQVQTGIPDSCSANFQTLAVSSTTLGRYFIAQPFDKNNKKPVQICWYFGDNHDSCIQYATTYTGAYAVYHLYTQAGTYNACIGILYDGGCESRFCNSVTVSGNADSCSANFEMLTTSPTSNGRYFVAQAWDNQNKKPLEVCWSFGDNHDTCIQYATAFTGNYAVFHNYLQSGSYNVCVTIHYDGGCESQYCKEVQIGVPDSCTANFERILTPNITSLILALQAITGDNHNNKPSRICWSFGDNHDTCINYTSTYTGLYNIYHKYDQSGQYDVCIDILYYGGCEAKTCKQITLVSPPDTCRVQVFEETPSINSLTRGFYALPVSSNNRAVESICWYFGDGSDTCMAFTPGITNTSEYFMSHTYPSPGVYNACVHVYFAGGCIAENCIEVAIRNTTDICGGYFVDSLSGPSTLKFRGQSIHNPNDNVVSYQWNFGDGSSATGQEVDHTFGPGNNFLVCLLINTEQGCESRICKPVILPGVNTAPTFQLSPNPVVSNLHVVFISNFSETVSIRIINSYGVVVRTYVETVIAGPNVWNFDLSTLISGIYSFTVQSSDQLASAIFLK